MDAHRVPVVLRQDRGVVALTVALLMIAFLGFAALVVDMGYNYTVKRQLQAAADAAALAGCQELILGASDANILGIAREYAENHNSANPGDGLSMVEDSSYTLVGPDFVQVTVEKPATLFFGRILTDDGGMIRAQAKARIAYLTGLRGILPWAVPMIRVDSVIVSLAGNTVEIKDPDASGDYVAQLPIPTASAQTGYDVRVVVRNSQTEYPDGTLDSSPDYHPEGVPEYVQNPKPPATSSPPASMVVLPTDAPIQGISLNKYWVVQGSGPGEDLTVDLTVRASDTPRIRFNGKNLVLQSVAGEEDLYRLSLEVPKTTQGLELFPISVTVGQGVDAFEVQNAAVLVVRRSTYPVHEVAMSTYVARESEGGLVTVRVSTNELEYGRWYTLKVLGGGGDVGNFMSIDLTQIKHTPLWRAQDDDEYDVPSSQWYTDALRSPFPHTVHIGDTIWTSTGTGPGPQVQSALNERFAGDQLSFSQWEGLGSPLGSRRIVYIPVMEKMQPTGGVSPLRVITFAAFYIEPEWAGSDYKNDVIRGRFVEYLAPSDDLTDVPPDSFAIMTPRLVSDGID